MTNVLVYVIIIGYYTVDFTIPKYIWPSAQIATILQEPVLVYLLIWNICVQSWTS